MQIRPIDANALKEALKCGAYSSVLKLIDRQPTLDYGPVVHCKDCKYRVYFAEKMFCGKVYALSVKPNHFCGYGAKMDEEVKG